MIGVSMARHRSKGLKENRILVAISILGLDENGYRRTQNEVCAVLGMPKSTVSECVRDLLEADYIIESGRSHRDKLYARGPKFCLLESQISDEIRENLRKLKSVRIDSPLSRRRTARNPPTAIPGLSRLRGRSTSLARC